ncbi:hypothetical protein GINT2_001044 [Glugoides intestinalis]
MSEQTRKRKARDQLSPYSQDSIEYTLDQGGDQETEKRPERIASAGRKAEVEKPSLKGIFGNIKLTEKKGETTYSEKAAMISGLNNSFLQAVKSILEKQTNKDMRYLFDQYDKFMKDIEENNQ